jgi:hypothetical protein
MPTIRHNKRCGRRRWRSSIRSERCGMSRLQQRLPGLPQRRARKRYDMRGRMDRLRKMQQRLRRGRPADAKSVAACRAGVAACHAGVAMFPASVAASPVDVSACCACLAAFCERRNAICVGWFACAACVAACSDCLIICVLRVAACARSDPGPVKSSIDDKRSSGCQPEFRATSVSGILDPALPCPSIAPGIRSDMRDWHPLGVRGQTRRILTTDFTYYWMCAFFSSARRSRIRRSPSLLDDSSETINGKSSNTSLSGVPDICTCQMCISGAAVLSNTPAPI